jgi:LmbE family N-acetylglucosaminyl deacetylase
MTHVFVAPHPDDIALSCGGLVASLREMGQNVTILCVYSGSSGGTGLNDYQRTALGFGNKTVWPLLESFRRDNIAPDYEIVATAAGRPPWMADPERIDLTQERANTQARQFWQRAAWTRSANITATESEERPLADSVSAQATLDGVNWAAADAMAVRRAEEERYAFLAEAAVVFLDLPDAVFRGYDGDEQLLGELRADDEPPYEIVRREIVRLEPQMVYFPLAVGNHVDHQLVREVALAMLAEGRRWVMPGPSMLGRLSFYEDFPYAWWDDFEGLTGRGDGLALDLPAGVGLEAQYCDITELLERKAAGIRLYASQLPRLFESDQALFDDLAGYHARVALAGGVSGYAERYWATVKP